MMVELWTRKREMGDEDENLYGGFQWTWQIRGRTYLTGCTRPHIGVIARRIGTRTCRIGDGILTRTWNSLKSQFLMMISPISSDLYLSYAQLYHHLRTRSYVTPLNLSMPWSWLNAEYSTHQVQHHSKFDSLPLAVSFPSLAGCCTLLSTFPQLQANQWIESQQPSRLPPNRQLPSTPAILLDHGLQVHLQTQSITAFQCISEFTQSRSPSASLSWLESGLQVHLRVHSISASRCISEFTQFRPASASLNSLDHSRQVHQYWMTASVRRYRGNGGELCDWEYIFWRLRGR